MTNIEFYEMAKYIVVTTTFMCMVGFGFASFCYFTFDFFTLLGRLASRFVKWIRVKF